MTEDATGEDRTSEDLPTSSATTAREQRPVLRGGVRAIATAPGQLVLVGGPETVTVPDTPEVLTLLQCLAGGVPVEPGDPESRLALMRVVAGGLTESYDVVSARATARRAARVLVDALDGPATTAVGLLLASGVAVTPVADRATHALVVGAGEVSRPRVDDWVRRGIEHLVVVEQGSAVVVGPYVAVGRTCCVHCLDAHATDRDPRHRGLVARVSEALPLTRGTDHAVLTAGLAWAVRDLVAAVEGARPSTWSATVTVRADPGSGVSTRRREWRRHPDCGCAWADSLRQPQVG